MRSTVFLLPLVAVVLAVVALTAALAPSPRPTLALGATAVAPGGSHTCALTAAGGVKCWGSNGFGQVGDGTSGNVRRFPANVSSLGSGAVDIAAGGQHSCALMAAGAVRCWGQNSDGQIGDGTTMQRPTPTFVCADEPCNSVLSDVAAIALGAQHTCALTEAGGVKCWGNNVLGQLGDGTNMARSAPVDVDGLTSGVAAIAAGFHHTCALTETGDVQCWGRNDYAQLGDGTMMDRTMPVDVAGLAGDVVGIGAGALHTCALAADGDAQCWGSNTSGQLGAVAMDTCGADPCSTTPLDVSGLSDAAEIDGGFSHTCTRTAAGGAKCWGDNSLGQLGNPNVFNSLDPVDVAALTDGVNAIGIGDLHSCAVTETGSVMCWGYNMFGPLGDGTDTERDVPTGVAGLSLAVTTSSNHTCSVTAASGVKCWGSNGDGQLGDGTNTSSTAPVDVVGITDDITAVTTGDPFVHDNGFVNSFHTCAVTSAGGVKCWGRNNTGQLGDGTTTDSSTPVDVTGLTSGVIAVGGGTLHTCALTTAGGVKCWGHNSHGQLGNGMTMNSTTPVDVSGLTAGVAAIAAGGSHSCALTTGGAVKCWGENGDGQGGNGMTADSSLPVDVSGEGNVIAIDAGGGHTCALTTARGMKCWGRNTWGQVGDGTMMDSSMAVDVSGLTTGVLAIATGGDHTCAVTTMGGVKCWGVNGNGRLGDGTTDNSSLPVNVLDLENAVAVSAGGGHSCAVTAASLKCWGYNDFGQVGDGTEDMDRLTPVDVLGFGPKSPPTPSPTASPSASPTGSATATPTGATATPTASPTATPTVSGTPPSPTPTSAPLPGDVNCDGEVNAIDAALILQLVAGLIDSLPCEGNADVNLDGDITAVDAALILQFVAGLIDSLPP